MSSKIENIIAEGSPVTIQGYPEPEKKEKSEWVVCEHGRANKDDYVIHFYPWHERMIFGERIGIVMSLIHDHLSKVIPGSLDVEVFPPDPQWWPHQPVSVVIKDAVNSWKFYVGDVEKALPECMKALDEFIIDEYQAQKKGL